MEVQDAYRAPAERAGDPEPPFTGEWDWVRVSDGVLVQIVECDVLEEVLPAVAAALERRGIEGAFDLRDPDGRNAAKQRSPAGVPRARPRRAAATRTRQLSVAG